MNPFIGHRSTPSRFLFHEPESRSFQNPPLHQNRQVVHQAGSPQRMEQPQPLMAQMPFRSRGRQVQQNTARELNFAQTMSRKLQYIFIAYSILELAGTITVLVLNWEKPCNQPLQLFIGVHSARLLYYLPQYFQRIRGIPETQDDIRRKSLINLLQFGWFIVGQSWFFDAESCRRTAPILYYWTMAMVITTYLVMLAPLLLLLGICFCLPCVLVFLRYITPNPGAQQEEIVQLPEHSFDPTRYRRGEAAAPVVSPVSPRAERELERVPSPVHRMERGEVALESPRIEVRPEYPPSAPPLPEVESPPARAAAAARPPARAPAHAVPEETPNCAICMEDFKAGDRLRSLPCKHDFHKECVDRWLAVNSTCPMCRASIFSRPNIQWDAPEY